MKSIQLDTVIHDPGIFWGDNPYTYPVNELYSTNDDLSYAPFHCHIARDGKSDISKKATAAHIIYGETHAIKIGLNGAASANKWDRISGSGLLFSSHRGPPRTQDAHDLQGSHKDPHSGQCLQFYTNNQTKHPTGLYLGRKTPDEYGYDGGNASEVAAFYNSKARWCTPIGCQFKWSSRGSKGASGAINFTKITLIYMDNWMPGRTLYMPLISTRGDEEKWGYFQNDNSFYRGSDPLRQEYNSNSSGDKLSPHWYGEVVAYAEPEVMDYLADPYTRAVCVGMYIECYQPNGQNAVFDCAREIFDFKFLFDMPDKNGNLFASKSRFIYPAPHSLSDALEGRDIQFTVETSSGKPNRPNFGGY
jgi:hypothetical protein